MTVSPPSNYNLVRKDFLHNFLVIESLMDHPSLLTMFVSDENVQRGKENTAHRCAIAEALKEYFGRNCSPWVEQVNASLVIRITDLKTRNRYTLNAIRLNEVGGFDPELYDKNHKNVSSGSIIINSVLEKTKIRDQSGRIKGEPMTKREPKEPRGWGADAKLKPFTSPIPKQNQKITASLNEEPPQTNFNFDVDETDDET